MDTISIIRLIFKGFEKSKTSAGRIKLSVGAGLARAGRSLDTSALDLEVKEIIDLKAYFLSPLL